MVTSGGNVKIADFGIAKALNSAATGMFRTDPGTTVGTPTYMSPEQAMARDIGPWSDLYSLGVMAYEILCGRVPFHDTEAPLAILMRQVNDPIPAASLGRARPRPEARRVDRAPAREGPERPLPARGRRVGGPRGARHLGPRAPLASGRAPQRPRGDAGAAAGAAQGRAAAARTVRAVRERGARGRRRAGLGLPDGRAAPAGARTTAGAENRPRCRRRRTLISRSRSRSPSRSRSQSPPRRQRPRSAR